MSDPTYDQEAYQESLRLDGQIEEATAEAIERGQRNADLEWLLYARRAIRVVALRQELFTADDVVRLMAEANVAPTHDARAMGGVFRWAKSARLCEPTGEFRPTDRVQGHGGPRRVWRSLMIGGSDE